jgi:hypothetical protein
VDAPVLASVGRQVELGEDAADVRLDGLACHEEVIGDPAVGLTLGDEREHLALARGELGERIAGGGGGEELVDERALDDGSAGGNLVQCVDELGDVGDPVFEQVADALGGAGDELQRVLDVEVLRKAPKPRTANVTVSPGDVMIRIATRPFSIAIASSRENSGAGLLRQLNTELRSLASELCDFTRPRRRSGRPSAAHERRTSRDGSRRRGGSSAARDPVGR